MSVQLSTYSLASNVENVVISEMRVIQTTLVFCKQESNLYICLYIALGIEEKKAIETQINTWNTKVSNNELTFKNVIDDCITIDNNNTQYEFCICDKILNSLKQHKMYINTKCCSIKV
jgi:hypothetical protein